MAKRTETDLVNDIAKPELVAALHVKCDRLLKKLASSYPQSEVDTWAFQVKEAQAFLDDNTVSTPFIDAAVKAGESKTAYAGLIIANNTAYAIYAGTVVKLRREYEAKIKVITTIAEADALKEEIAAL